MRGVASILVAVRNVEACLNCSGLTLSGQFEQIARLMMAEPEAIRDRVQFLYFERTDERTYFGSSIPRVSSPTELASEEYYYTRTLPTSISDESTASSDFKYHISFTSSRKRTGSSTSTAASTASRHFTPTLDQQLLTTPYDYGYDLPCEFMFLGCYLRFHATQYDAWVTHSMSHFCKRPPPPKVVCTICDNGDDACFERNGDARSNWRERMSHISEHFERRDVINHIRPDYFVIKYMKSNNLISKEDYEYAMQYTERPGIDGLLPLGSPIPGHHPKRDVKQEQYDLVKERRKMKELSWKRKTGQGKRTYGSSH